MSRTAPQTRRAAVLAGAVLLLVMINFAMLSAVIAGGDDNRLAGWRAESLRARLAMESARHIYITEAEAGRPIPTDPVQLPEGETIFIGPVEEDDVTIRGVSGQAAREETINVTSEADDDDEGGPGIGAPSGPSSKKKAKKKGSSKKKASKSSSKKKSSGKKSSSKKKSSKKKASATPRDDGTALARASSGPSRKLVSSRRQPAVIGPKSDLRRTDA